MLSERLHSEIDSPWYMYLVSCQIKRHYNSFAVACVAVAESVPAASSGPAIDELRHVFTIVAACGIIGLRLSEPLNQINCFGR